METIRCLSRSTQHRLKRAYSDRITFYGNFDCGNTLSFASPGEVAAYTRQCIEAGSGDVHPGRARCGLYPEAFGKKQPRWDEVNALWKKHYPLALHFYREILACSPSSMSITGLIEDGIFEEYIQPSVVLFAEML